MPTQRGYRYKCPAIRTTLVCPGHVQTPLFQNVAWPTYPLFSFLCPSVQPVSVVKKIIAALDDQHSQKILLPFYVNFVPLVSLLPSFLRDAFQWVLPFLLNGCNTADHLNQAAGADYAMQNFVKTSGRRPDEGLTPGDSASKQES